jgi:hypothetical protein
MLNLVICKVTARMAHDMQVYSFCSPLQARLVTAVRFSSLYAARSNKQVPSQVTHIICLFFVSLFFTTEHMRMTNVILAANCQSF